MALYFPIKISTFSVLFYLHFYWLFTLLLKSLLSLYCSIETSTFSLLFSLHFYFFTFLLKSLLSLYFCIETSTFSLLFDWDVYPPTCAPAPHLHQHYVAKSNHALLPRCNYARKNFEEKLRPPCHAAPKPRHPQHLTPLSFGTPCIQIYCDNTGGSHASLLSNLHVVPRLPRKVPLYTEPNAPLHHICTSITLRKVTQCNYAPRVCLHHICTSITLPKKQSRLASPNGTTLKTTHHMCACTASAPALHCEK